MISCLYRGKRRRRSFLVYKEGRDGEGDFLFIRGKRWRRLFLVYKEGRDGEGHFLFI